MSRDVVGISLCVRGIPCDVVGISSGIVGMLSDVLGIGLSSDVGGILIGVVGKSSCMIDVLNGGELWGGCPDEHLGMTPTLGAE